MMGDFNGVFNTSMDKSTIGVIYSGISKEFKHWLRNKGLIDVLRKEHGNLQNYTFYSARHNSYSQLGAPF